MQSITCRIGKHNRIVVAVSEEIVALQAAVGAEDGIRAEEPADIGIVVSAVEVVPASLYIVVIAPVSEQVYIGDMGRVTRDIIPDILSITSIVYFNCLKHFTVFKK